MIEYDYYNLNLGRYEVPCTSKHLLSSYRKILDVDSRIIPLGCFIEKTHCNVYFALSFIPELKVFRDSFFIEEEIDVSDVIKRLVERIKYESELVRKNV